MSKQTLYSAEHHTLMSRALRAYEFEPSQGLSGSGTYMPVLNHNKL